MSVKDRIPAQSTIFGTILMAAGTAVFLVWLFAWPSDFLRESPLIAAGMTTFGLGFGYLLISGEGATVGEVARSWFGRRGAPPGAGQ